MRSMLALGHAPRSPALGFLCSMQLLPPQKTRGLGQVLGGQRVSSPFAPAQPEDNRYMFGTSQSREVGVQTCVPSSPWLLYSLYGEARTTLSELAAAQKLFNRKFMFMRSHGG